VIPVGEDADRQELYRVRRVTGDRLEREHLVSVRFVPLVGAEGWTDDAARRQRS
jgi:protein-L-isoaspartate(D-aspartate) O-methyltransferase